MIKSVGKNRCCGCEGCVQACPKHCISMVEDAEGFLYPQVDTQSCVKCGRCLKVCPILNKLECSNPVAGYAYRSTNEELLKRTSSGGFFTAAAEKILDGGGVVFGAAFNDQNEVVHCFIETEGDLDKLRRSKYVQSRIGTAYLDCKRFLEGGRKVLFCGTPCQVKALNLFLGDKPANLITIDFVCHGVPSPDVFKRYLEEIAKSKGGTAEQICEINFREKDGGYSYSFGYSVGQRRMIESPRENKFLRGFLGDLYLRRSCHSCPAKGFTSGSDYTMCDFWTVKKYMPDFPLGDVPGVNQVFVHSDKLKMFEQENTSANIRKFNVEDGRLIQCWAKRSVPLTWRRKKFFSMFTRGQMSLSEMILKTLRRTPVEVMKDLAKRSLGRILSGVGLR